MEPSAVILMVVGMVVIWGGFAASVLHAVRTSRANRRANGGANRGGNGGANGGANRGAADRGTPSRDE